MTKTAQGSNTLAPKSKAGGRKLGSAVFQRVQTTNADRASVSDTARRREHEEGNVHDHRVAESRRSSRVRELETAASKFGVPAMTSSRTGGVALTGDTVELVLCQWPARGRALL